MLWQVWKELGYESIELIEQELDSFKILSQDISKHFLEKHGKTFKGKLFILDEMIEESHDKIHPLAVGYQRVVVRIHPQEIVQDLIKIS